MLGQVAASVPVFEFGEISQDALLRDVEDSESSALDHPSLTDISSFSGDVQRLWATAFREAATRRSLARPRACARWLFAPWMLAGLPLTICRRICCLLCCLMFKETVTQTARMIFNISSRFSSLS